MKRILALALVLVMLATGMGVGWAETGDAAQIQEKVDQLQAELDALRAQLQGGDGATQAEEPQQTAEPAETEQTVKPKGQSLVRFLAGYMLGMEEVRGEKTQYQLRLFHNIFQCVVIDNPNSAHDMIVASVNEFDGSVIHIDGGPNSFSVLYDDPEPYKQDTMVVLYAMLDNLPIVLSREYCDYIKEHMDADWEMVKGKVAESKKLGKKIRQSWGECYVIEFSPLTERCVIRIHRQQDAY